MIPVPPKFRAMVVALGATCLLGLAPAGAQADPYTVDFCKHFDTGAPAPVFDSLTLSGAATLANSCSADNPLAGLSAQVGGGQMPPESHVNLALSIPPGLPNLRIERVETQYSAPPNTGPPGFLSVTTDGTTLVTRATDTAATQNDVFATPLGTRAIHWDVYCSNNPGTCQFAGAPTVLTVLRTRLTVNESVNPVLTVTGGALVATGAKSGQQSLTFDAQDADSGVASVTAALDTTVVGASASACARADWSACPRDRLGQVLQVDTTKAPDGNHELLVTVRDAANNAVTRSLGTVTVANGPGPAVPNGSGASRLVKLTAAFTTTKKRSRELSYTGRPTVKGTLVNESGQPITGATVAILARLRQSGAQPVQIATVTTGADGAFATKLAGGPSRTLTFAYTAFSGDAKPAATSTLRTVVRAVVSARISPRSVRAGRRLRLSGRLSLPPRRGVQVTIQARDGRRWRTVDSVRTTRTGSFSWPYRFKPSAAGHTFAFRARVTSPIYPFAAGNSKTLLVRVR